MISNKIYVWQNIETISNKCILEQLKSKNQDKYLK